MIDSRHIFTLGSFFWDRSNPGAYNWSEARKNLPWKLPPLFSRSCKLRLLNTLFGTLYSQCFNISKNRLIYTVSSLLWAIFIVIYILLYSWSKWIDVHCLLLILKRDTESLMCCFGQTHVKCAVQDFQSKSLLDILIYFDTFIKKIGHCLMLIFLY